MKEKWLALQEKIDARVLRERAILFVFALAIVFFLWNFLLQSAIDKKAADIKEQITAAAQQKVALQTQMVAIGQAMMNDPVRVKANQVEQLKGDIGNVDGQLQTASQSLIEAKMLPVALQEVLQKTSQLKLLEVKTYAARGLAIDQIKNFDAKKQSDKPNKLNADNSVDETGVFAHEVQIKVSGNYFQVLNFIKSLEQLPWRFYWQRMDYQVKEYPNAIVTLKVYTLSLDEGLLGV